MPRKFPNVTLEVLGIIVFTMVLVASPSMEASVVCSAMIAVIVMVIMVRFHDTRQKHHKHLQFRENQRKQYR